MMLVTTSRKPGQLTRAVARTLANGLGAEFLNRGKSGVDSVLAEAEKLGVSKVLFVWERNGNPSRLVAFDMEKAAEMPDPQNEGEGDEGKEGEAEERERNAGGNKKGNRGKGGGGKKGDASNTGEGEAEGSGGNGAGGKSGVFGGKGEAGESEDDGSAGGGKGGKSKKGGAGKIGDGELGGLAAGGSGEEGNGNGRTGGKGGEGKKAKGSRVGRRKAGGDDVAGASDGAVVPVSGGQEDSAEDPAWLKPEIRLGGAVFPRIPVRRKGCRVVAEDPFGKEAAKLFSPSEGPNKILLSRFGLKLYLEGELLLELRFTNQ